MGTRSLKMAMVRRKEHQKKVFITIRKKEKAPLNIAIAKILIYKFSLVPKFIQVF